MIILQLSVMYIIVMFINTKIHVIPWVHFIIIMCYCSLLVLTIIET